MSSLVLPEPIWRQLQSAGCGRQPRLMAWRVMRQFASPAAIEAEFGVSTGWHWQLRRPLGEPQQQALKLLLVNAKGVQCETVVLFPNGPRQPTAGARRRATVCVSSQPGCGVGCAFCATATLGYRGNFTAEEIVEQVYWAGLTAADHQRQLRNVVYMGMGEPLHNLPGVLESLDWLTRDSGFGISPQRITVSTAGVPTAAVQLARQFPRVRLAFSLHAAEASLRRQLVPRAVGDLHILREMIVELNRLQTQPLWLEIVMLEGVNDGLEHARQLVAFCDGLRVEVNLIPYNTAPGVGRFHASARATREAFAQVLRDSGIRTSIRTSFGSQANAACGQLTAAAARTPEPQADLVNRRVSEEA